MKEVYSNLFVGSLNDIEVFREHVIKSKIAVDDVYILHAAKEPYHRKALGYTGRAAPKGHPEYLVARRKNRLILNLVDVPVEKASYIPDACLDAAIDFIHWVCIEQKKVLFLHCNHGVSRSPSIALMFLIQHTDFAHGLKLFESVEEKFLNIYPDYHPQGIREKTRERFERGYKNETKT